MAADFSKNGIGAEGCEQLCTVLPNNSGLQNLLLDTNALGDEGASMLATVRTLRCCNAQGGHITPAREGGSAASGLRRARGGSAGTRD